MKHNHFLKGIIILFGIIAFFFLLFFLQKKIDNKFLFDAKEIYSFNVNYVDFNKNVEKNIDKILKNKEYDFDNPKVLLNPYNNSPLTALAIFRTDVACEIEVWINGELMTTMEKNNEHIIPLYGLLPNYKNEIMFVCEAQTKKITIKTDKIINGIDYDYKSSNDTNDALFLNFYTKKYALDNLGNINWYYKDKGYIFGINEEKKLYLFDRFNRINKIDFLGRVEKVYNDSYLPTMHHAIILKNNNLMILSSAFVLSEIDSKDSRVVKKINFLKILKEIDPNFDTGMKSKNDSKNFYINYFQYDEEKNTILVSLRGHNAVINYDLTNEEILWIFTDSKSFSDKYNKYKLKLEMGDYFKGQHTPYLVGDKLYLFDNHNNAVYNSVIGDLSKSSAVIYKIDGMSAKEIYRYKGEHISLWYGSFFEKDDVKTINFGNAVDRKSGDYYSAIVELDADNKVITKLSAVLTNAEASHSETLNCPYQVFRERFYNDKTSNYEYQTSLEQGNQDSVGKNLKFIKLDKTIKENLKKSMLDETLIEVDDENNIKVNINEKFDLLLVSKNNEYLSVNIKNFVYAANNVNKIITKLSGDYAVFVKISDEYYNTNKIFKLS